MELTYSPPDGSLRETLFGIPPSNRGAYTDSMDGIDTRVVQPGLIFFFNFLLKEQPLC